MGSFDQEDMMVEWLEYII